MNGMLTFIGGYGSMILPMIGENVINREQIHQPADLVIACQAKWLVYTCRKFVLVMICPVVLVVESLHVLTLSCREQEVEMVRLFGNQSGLFEKAHEICLTRRVPLQRHVVVHAKSSIPDEVNERGTHFKGGGPLWGE